MRTLNLLNRCALNIFKLMNLVLRVCGLSTFVYRPQQGGFVSLEPLRWYAFILTCFGALVCPLMVFVVIATGNKGGLEWIRATVKTVICSMARMHQSAYEDQLIVLLTEIHAIFGELRLLARHPNFFRWSHLMLCMVALQSMVRSLIAIQVGDMKGKYVTIVFMLLFRAVFIVAVTVIMMVFVVLIACYDELHRCTRRASNDVREVRMARMDGGQRMILVEQLRCYLEQLVAVRARLFGVAVKLIRYFRFHLLMAMLYWLGHEIMTFVMDSDDSERMTFYKISVGLLNLAYYCTLFQIFVWKSQVSKSFWNLHLLNFHKSFDRTVDELIHRELVENIKVSAYGIRLDMKLFCKILMHTYGYFLMFFVYKKI